MTDLNSTLRDEFLIVTAYSKCYQASTNHCKMDTKHCVLTVLQSPEPQLAYYGNAKHEQRMGMRKLSKATRNVTDQSQQMAL